MPPIAYLLLAILTTLSGTALPLAPGDQRRRLTESTVVDYPAPPPTIQGLWRTSAAVVRATVTAVGAPDATDTELVFRLYTARVVEVLKRRTDSVPIPASVTIRQFGGTTIAGHVELNTSYPDVRLRVGGEYVLFLTDSNVQETYQTAFGSAGVFAFSQLGTEVVVPAVASAIITELRGLRSIPTEKFLGTLRDFGGGEGDEVNPTSQILRRSPRS